MQLNSIIVNNFRQYYGEQKIEFAKGDKNVTIIFGENGKGKTGLFRALIFGLFGERYINQDNVNDVIHLVNFNALEKSNGYPIEACVTVNFSHKQKEYSIKRKVVGYKADNKITEKINGIELSIKDENGNYDNKNDLTDDEKNKIVGTIFDSKIKDFFLFDAERIETLAKTNKESKVEVEHGIKNLLNIDKLQKAVDITGALIKEERRNISSRVNSSEVTKCEETIKNIEEEIKNIEETIDTKKNEELACQGEIEAIDKKLRENESIRLIQDDIKAKKIYKASKEELLASEKQAIKEKSFYKCHMLLMEPSYEMAKDYLGQVVIKQKDLIPLEIIEKSLNDKICSCCKVDLSKNIEAYNEIVKLKKNFKRSELTPLISEITNTINEFLQEKDMELNSIKERLTRIREIKDEIEGIQEEINKLNDKARGKSKGTANLEELEKSKKRCEENKEKLKKDISNLEGRKDSSIDILNKEKRKYDRLISENEAVKFDSQKLEYMKKLNEDLQNILDGYSETMRKNLMEETTEIFKKLIDKNDKVQISKININSKYEIQVINRLETIITQDISQGQRQIVALAFITALAKVAGGDDSSIDFPLFMDTPFGRISGDNRDNLIKNIPLLANQWVLLLTDTELTINEELKIKEVGKLGKWYRLNQISDGYSKIEEVSLDSKMSTRG